LARLPLLALNYENLLAACNGGNQSNRRNDTKRHHCDVKKDNIKLNVLPNPTSKENDYQDIVTYSSKGKIEANKNLTVEQQQNITQDINDILNLNLDFLIQNRVEARQTVITNIHKMKQNGTWQKVSKKVIDKYNPTGKGRKSPYCGYIYFWLKKRFKL
jgi:hypothetical protein